MDDRWGTIVPYCTGFSFSRTYDGSCCDTFDAVGNYYRIVQTLDCSFMRPSGYCRPWISQINKEIYNNHSMHRMNCISYIIPTKTA
jgi:hypothetical protein